MNKISIKISIDNKKFYNMLIEESEKYNQYCTHSAIIAKEVQHIVNKVVFRIKLDFI